LALYGFELVTILRARKRRVLDWGIRTFLTAVGFLLPLSLLALVLSWPALPLNALSGRLENLYGFLALAGFISLALIGMLYKIIPFLVWFGTYSKRIGFSKVPALAELYSERLQAIGCFLFLAGVLAISAGILAANGGAIRLGAALFTASLCALLLNVARMLAHFIRPQIEPLKATTPLAK
jgi:hypothetical protein